MRTFKNTDEIRTERAANRNNPVIYSLLAVLLGELDRRPNQNTPITEGDIYKTIKKLYDAAIECGNKEEEDYLTQFIRQQMTPEQIELAVIGMLEDPTIKNMGDAMKVFAVHFPGQYDGKVVSGVVRKYFK